MKPRDGIYYEDRYSNVDANTDCKQLCRNICHTSPIGSACMDCLSACEDSKVDRTGGGNGGDGNGGGGNGTNGNGNGGDGKGMDIKTIMLWAGLSLFVIALIIGGAYAIKKIRS